MEIEVEDIAKNEWRTTLDINVAMVNGYIGENFCDIRPSVNAIRKELGLKHLRDRLHWFYYGTPDSRLKTMFGYV